MLLPFRKNFYYKIDLPEQEKKHVFSKRERILSNVKHYIDNILDPRKRNILNSQEGNFEQVSSIKNIYSSKLGFLEKEFYDALTISSD